MQIGYLLKASAKHRCQDCKLRNTEYCKCYEKGHIAIVCKSKNFSSSRKHHSTRSKEHLNDKFTSKCSNSSVNLINASPQVCTNSQVPQTGLFAVQLQINPNPLRILLDTDSPFTIPSQDAWKKIGSPSLFLTPVCANSYSGDSVAFAGELTANFHFQSNVFFTYSHVGNK